MTTTPTSGAADLLTLIEAYAEARHCKGHSSYNAQTATALQAVKDALAAGQATAAQAVVLDDVAALVRAAQAFVLEPDSHKKKLELEAMAWGPLAAATQPAPVLWLSPEQFANFTDTDEAPFGKYIPARKTSAGKFTMPLFAARAPAPAQPAGMTDDEKHLRRMLCVAHAGALAYMDDGEASDSRMHPTIDFLRDSPKDIQRKIGERNRAAFTAAPAQPVAQQGVAQQEAQEPATVPRFNCWSTNEGDSWFDHPAYSQAIYDCLGNDAKVGDEYELTAGWKSVTARYRITEVVGDGEEYEVECISHPHENSALQSPTAQAAGNVPAIADLPPLPDIDLRDVGTKPQDVKDFLNGYATEYARLALAARAPADAVLYDPEAVLEIFQSARAGSDKPLGYLRGILAVIAHWESRPEPHRWMVPAPAESVTAPAPPPECETEAEKRAFAFGWFKAMESERMKAESVQEDAARYRWLAASCRSTSEHWGGRWSIIIDGPAPKSHDSEDDFDAAVDAARKQGATQ